MRNCFVDSKKLKVHGIFPSPRTARPNRLGSDALPDKDVYRTYPEVSKAAKIAAAAHLAAKDGFLISNAPHAAERSSFLLRCLPKKTPRGTTASACYEVTHRRVALEGKDN